MHMQGMRTYGHIIFLGILTLGTALIWYAVFYVEAHHNLIMTMFDIGQGDSIFIQTGNSTQVLIDGGPSDAVLTKLGEVMPFWDRTIDLVILTHPHADHVIGLMGVLKRYRIGRILESDVNYTTPEYQEWHTLLQQKHIPITIAHRGQIVHLAPQTQLNILAPFDSFVGKSPKNIHDAMIVAKLRDGSATALLTGDAEKPLEYQMLFAGDNLKSDILKVGHHGSKTSTAPDFIAAVAPRYAVISVGRKNRYGHPHHQTLDTLTGFGIRIFRTDQEGDVRLVSDGKAFIKAE